MKKFYRIILFTSIILPLLISTDILAANGKIKGRIIDRTTGDPLPGVNVLITHEILSGGKEVSLSQSLGAATDLDGYYFILNVPAGQYTLRASIVGYSPVIKTPIKVDLDRTVEVDYQLEPATIEVGQVVVVAEREIIKQDISSTQEVIVTQRLEQMPIQRVDEFIGTLKGVEIQSSSQGNGLSFRGGAIRETDVRLDGLSLRDPRSENSYISLNSTAIKEIQVLTGGFQAKYGGIMSGLLNVVTKEGQRDKYNLSIRADVTPAQKRYFGTDPYSKDSWIYKVFSDTTENGYAWRGVKTKTDSLLVPAEFWGFKGWSKTLSSTETKALDSLQKLDLWNLQHPKYSYGIKPDIFIEGTITGPFPGDFIPFFGEFAKRTTFMAGFKYENSQLAFPVGPRDNYVDWNGQLKLTTQLNQDMRLSLNGLMTNISTVSGGGFSSYGGALLGETSSFSFLNTTETSVKRTASLIGSTNFYQLYNKSRLQFYDQRYFVGGAKFVHTVSERAYYTVDFQMGYTDQGLKPFSMDTSVASNYVNFYSTKAKRNFKFNVPNYGSPNSSTNYGYDVLNMFAMYGGPQKIDSSYSYAYQLKGDLTVQVGHHHQFEGGFSAILQDMLVYSGTWYQSQLSFTPDTWQYYKASPLEMGLYAQDKLEFEGMILNAGIRLDYFNARKNGFQVGFPEDEDYKEFLNTIYNNLGGDAASYERWLLWRDLLSNPPGWPRTENKAQVHLSPRLGVSFPVTESSKLYFNYGHFYQRAPISFLYNTYVVQGGVSVPSPNLEMEKTISYEFGYEQMFFNDFLVNITAYYKDIRNQPLSRTYINYYGDNLVTQYVSDAYRDVRGFELRLERPFGRFVTFSGMYDYMLSSDGQTGYANIFEDRLLARDNELRTPELSQTDPVPRGNFNINLHTPSDFGDIFGDWYINYFFQWKNGGRFLANPEVKEAKDRIYVDIVDYYNTDLKLSKAINTAYGSFEILLTVKNLYDTKFLSTANMTRVQYDEYKNSLKTPDKGGTDKWGEYDKPYIKTGWYDAAIFLNPRRFILGVRVNI